MKGRGVKKTVNHVWLDAATDFKFEDLPERSPAQFQKTGRLYCQHCGGAAPIPNGAPRWFGGVCELFSKAHASCAVPLTND